MDGLTRLMESDIDGSEPVNLGNPEEWMVRELAEFIASPIGTDGEIVHLPLPEDDPRRRRPDITRARQWLGWELHVPLRQGLAHTAERFATEINLPHLVQERGEDVAVAA